MEQDILPGFTGLLTDTPESVEALPQHELFAGAGELVKSWRPYGPKFKNQGSSYWCTGFAGAAIGSMFEKRETGREIEFSRYELFYRAGGQLNGNYLIATGNSMRDGFVLENDKPTPMPNSWGAEVFNRYKQASVATAQMLERGKPFAIKSQAVVSPTWSAMKKALGTSPLSIAIGIGETYWDEIAKAPKRVSAYHNVVITELIEDANGKPVAIEIFDSLSPRGGFDGYHKLEPDYPMDLVVSFIDLPTDWKEQQQAEKDKTFGFALAHYGEKRVLIEEQHAAAKINFALVEHPTVKSLFGKQWTVCTNAIAYGGYSVTDLLNHFTSIRRGQGEIFDLNKKK